MEAIEIPDYVRDYEQFWAGIVAPEGQLDLDAVQRELWDYRRMMDNYTTVLYHATAGTLSKPNTDGHKALGMIDDRQNTLHRHYLAQEITDECEADDGPCGNCLAYALKVNPCGDHRR